jgi:parallel beta-helix repeat protein
VEGASSPTIQNNVFSNNSSFGIYCYSFGNGGTPLIYNNTMDGNRRGISLYAFSPRIRNNIITNSREYGIYLAFSSNPDSDYNDVWSSILDNYYGVSPAAHDKSVDPVYLGSGDYSLQTTPVSPCMGGH